MCFGVTYEGLKLGGIPLVGATRCGFGVTYEGLKRDTSLNASIRESAVLELPMRV